MLYSHRVRAEDFFFFFDPAKKWKEICLLFVCLIDCAEDFLLSSVTISAARIFRPEGIVSKNQIFWPYYLSSIVRE
jgi:hypothetical protein